MTENMGTGITIVGLFIRIREAEIFLNIGTGFGCQYRIGTET
ncbi:MAG: hypothetical protein AB7S75_14875 [Desulfococcaceae bacterium]